MVRTIALSCDLQASPEKLREAILKPALFLHVAAPLVKFVPVGLARFPDIWSEGEYRGSMRLFGLIPIGWQAIVIEIPREDSKPLVLRDRGYGPLLRVWDHQIEVTPTAAGSRYTDRLTIDAGWLTPLTAFFVKRFFEHRQRRLKALDRRGIRTLR